MYSAVVTSSVASLIVVSTDPSTNIENPSQLAVRGRSAVEQWRRSSLSGARELVSAGTSLWKRDVVFVMVGG